MTIIVVCVIGQGTFPSSALLDSGVIGVPGGIEVALCRPTITSMRQNGCRTVCYMWS